MTVPELETLVAVPRAQQSRPPNRRLTGVVAVVVAGSALAVVTLALCTLAILGHRTTPSGWWIVGMAALLAVGELPLAQIRFGHAQGEAYSVVEVAVLAALIALPAGWTPVLAVAVSLTSALAGRTRVKILFNTANAVVGAGLATAVFWLLGGSPFPVGWHSGLAVAVAVL